MAHPSGVSTKHPEWIERVKRAEGGSVPTPQEDPRTDYRQARRTIKQEPPVTVMEDVVGRFNEAKGQDNAFRDAVRGKAFKTINDSGYER